MIMKISCSIPMSFSLSSVVLDLHYKATDSIVQGMSWVIDQLSFNPAA
jgi:hypothetical protein